MRQACRCESGEAISKVSYKVMLGTIKVYVSGELYYGIPTGSP